MLGPISMGVSHTRKLPFMYWNQQTADYYAGHCKIDLDIDRITFKVLGKSYLIFLPQWITLKGRSLDQRRGQIT